MKPNLDIYGVYVPTLAGLMIIAYVLNTIFERILSRIGCYSLVWHRPLFNTAMYIITLWAVLVLSKDFPL